MEPAYSINQDKYGGMSQLVVQFQTAATQSWKLATYTVAVEDTLLHPSHNTPHSSLVKSQVLRYIRHKWVIDKSLAMPPSFFTPSIQSKHLTCVSYLFNLRLAPCPVHHITPDCWTFWPEPLNLSSMRWSKGWDTTARIVHVRDHEFVCVCVFSLCSCVLYDVSDLMCNRNIKTLKQRSPEDERWVKTFSCGHNALWGDLT